MSKKVKDLLKQFKAQEKAIRRIIPTKPAQYFDDGRHTENQKYKTKYNCLSAEELDEILADEY